MAQHLQPLADRQQLGRFGCGRRHRGGSGSRRDHWRRQQPLQEGTARRRRLIAGRCGNGYVSHDPVSFQGFRVAVRAGRELHLPSGSLLG